MKSQYVRKNRILLVILILVVSLSIVGVALAAASQAGNAITTAAQLPPDQVGGKSELSLPPSAMQPSYSPPVVQSPPDPQMEKMRLQTMADSQVRSERVTAAISC